MNTWKRGRIGGQRIDPATGWGVRRTTGYLGIGGGEGGSAYPPKTYDQADLVWATWLAVGVAYEAHALLNKQQHRTASQTTRRWWMVDTVPGRVAFLATTGWFIGHIMRWWR